MKKALFIDRDGTLIVEPADEQVDSLEKLEFIPKVFRNLFNIKKNLDFELVIVSNQDGLGTNSYPEEKFKLVQEKFLKTFENEGVTFDDILIDKHFPKDKAPTRKPETGLLKKYMSGDYNLENSFVIGDRITDIMLAKNIGSKGILLSTDISKKEIENLKLKEFCILQTTDWDKIYEFLALGERKAEVIRKTKETDVQIQLDVNGNGNSDVKTGLKFFDHMLEQIARHSGCDLSIKVNGDLEVDEHHTIEDTALALGETFYKAIGDKRGMERYGFALPMDDCNALVSIDFGGRPWLVWETEFKRELVGDMPAEMFFHFFKSFADMARCNIYVKADGNNEHHKIEAIFKAFAKALKMAVQRNPFNYKLPSTKGVL